MTLMSEFECHWRYRLEPAPDLVKPPLELLLMEIKDQWRWCPPIVLLATALSDLLPYWHQHWYLVLHSKNRKITLLKLLHSIGAPFAAT